MSPVQYDMKQFGELAYTIKALSEPRRLRTVQLLLDWPYSFIGTPDLITNLGLGERARDADLIGFRRDMKYLEECGYIDYKWDNLKRNIKLKVASIKSDWHIKLLLHHFSRFQKGKHELHETIQGLSNQNRLAIVKLLLKKPKKERSSIEITEHLYHLSGGYSRTGVSNNIKKLHDTGFIYCRTEDMYLGTWIGVRKARPRFIRVKHPESLVEILEISSRFKNKRLKRKK